MELQHGRSCSLWSEESKVLKENFTDKVKIKQQTVLLYCTHYHPKRDRELESTIYQGLMKLWAGIQQRGFRSHGHLLQVGGCGPTCFHTRLIRYQRFVSCKHLSKRPFTPKILTFLTIWFYYTVLYHQTQRIIREDLQPKERF